MRDFTTGEIDRIRSTHVATMGSDTAVGFTAVIKSQDGDTTKVAALACSHLKPMDGQAKERAGMATIKRAYTCECEINTTISPRMRLTFDGNDYRIHDVVPTPENSPLYYVLFLENEPK